MLSMIFRYPILMSIGNGNINYIQLPIKDDDDVRLLFHVVAQIPPSNTIEMYLQTRPRDHSSELSPSFDQEIMGHDVEIPAKGNSAVQIDEMDENLAHNDEMGGNLAVDEINEMHYDDEPPTNKVSSDDGEHIMPSPMFKQLNWDAINSMTAEPLTPRTGLWNESNELFKGLRFESKEDLQYAVKRYAICRNQHLVVCESEPQLWAVRCKKWQEGCNWRLRACRCKSHGMFEITKYAALPKWMNILQLTNPGTKVVWKTIPLEDFWERAVYACFWAFGASVEGFKHCRPIIQIDGTFLYGKYMGKLLIATSIDGNGHVFPLAFAIVEKNHRIVGLGFLLH
ncbi:hypothetical protein CK203_076086 [Vitis vinifera]|uniref:Transposase MuDR plant domain-containing protein n=1 Tax=Vitis vinifera TaxID=29760 RepID=A0A438ELX9_VITVI|nr:hypothetical protein CK203_076086 [Vitis vinifera]